MKQSTKLLSLVLALVMAFSCMTVIGNAALVKSEVTWDNIDDAQLKNHKIRPLFKILLCIFHNRLCKVILLYCVPFAFSITFVCFILVLCGFEIKLRL